VVQSLASWSSSYSCRMCRCCIVYALSWRDKITITAALAGLPEIGKFIARARACTNVGASYRCISSDCLRRLATLPTGKGSSDSQKSKMAAKKDVVASMLKLADKTAGRDRICRFCSYLTNTVGLILIENWCHTPPYWSTRLVQYGSRFVYWVMEQEGVSPEMVKKLRELESSISTARKCEGED